jgi:membrane associated rhomboid family serine protease
MFFPIGDDQVKGGHRPFIIYLLLAINVAVFIWQQQLPAQEMETVLQLYGSAPIDIVHGERLYSLFTSIFLHGSWAHLLGNMLFLWIFGDNIEATIGSGRFLLFYLLGAMAAHLGHIWFYADSTIPVVGASGAIAAIMGAYFVMFPGSRIIVWFFFLTFRVSAFVFLGLWIFQQWLNGQEALLLAASGGAGVAWWAHIGGFVFGLPMGIYYRFRWVSQEDS